jgi:hypothetical protein
MKYHICPWAFLGPCHKKCFRDLPIEMARDFQPSTYAENKDAHIYICHTGWWYTYPSEKYESQLGVLFPIYGKIKNPNHQPAHTHTHIYISLSLIHIYIYYYILRI